MAWGAGIYNAKGTDFGYGMKTGAAFNLHFTDKKNSGVSIGMGYKYHAPGGYFQVGLFF